MQHFLPSLSPVILFYYDRNDTVLFWPILVQCPIFGSNGISVAPQHWECCFCQYWLHLIPKLVCQHVPQLVHKTIFKMCFVYTLSGGGRGDNLLQSKVLEGGAGCLLHRIVLRNHHHTSGGMLIHDSTTMTFH